MNAEKKTGSLIVTKAADVGIDVAAIKKLMEARGIDTEKISPEVAASRFFRVVASTEDVDGIGDVVKCDGWDLETWLSNPAMFADHKQTLEGTVARGLQAFIDTTAKSLVIDGFFLPPELDRSGLAEFVMGLYQSGLAKGLSIGAVPVKCHYATKADGELYGPDVRRVWDKSRLLETSFVGIPMNSQALVAHVAKSVSEGSMSRDMVSAVAETAGEWSICAKAALYAVKSAEPPASVVPDPPEPPAPVVPIVDPEVKAMLQAMQEQIATQGHAIKRMSVKADVVHATPEEIQTAIEYIGMAVEILAKLLPEPEDDNDPPPPSEEDAAATIVDGDKCDKSAQQFQLLAEAVQKHHPELTTKETTNG